MKKYQNKIYKYFIDTWDIFKTWNLHGIHDEESLTLRPIQQSTS